MFEWADGKGIPEDVVGNSPGERAAALRVVSGWGEEFVAMLGLDT